MCIIIDACRVANYLKQGEEKGSIKKWITKKKGRMLLCPELLHEYVSKKDQGNSKMLSHVKAMRLINKVRDLNEDEMATGNIKLNRILRDKKITQLSGDDHILNMAAFAKCKLLFTDDGNLTDDFKKILGGSVVPDLGTDAQQLLNKNPCD